MGSTTVSKQHATRSSPFRLLKSVRSQTPTPPPVLHPVYLWGVWFFIADVEAYETLLCISNRICFSGSEEMTAWGSIGQVVICGEQQTRTSQQWTRWCVFFFLAFPALLTSTTHYPAFPFTSFWTLPQQQRQQLTITDAIESPAVLFSATKPTVYVQVCEII